MTAPQSSRRPDTSTGTSDLKLSRIAAAALAAVTTALVASKLGAEGTLIGAAAASMITTVATSLYQTSLERSQQRVRSLAQRSRTAHPTAVATLPGRGEFVDGRRHDAEQPPGRSGRSARWRWAAVALGAFGGFALAMMVITGFEWASGQAVGGNGKGTTIGQVVRDQSGPQRPSTPPAGPASQTPTETPTDTSEPSPTQTTAPTGGTSVERSPTQTTSDTPTPSPTTPPPLIPPLPGIGG
ncbi:MAG TPA: hypothetical protein VFA63_10235 [Pseudonocardiaceae bacterium]|jgi:hypothetical protein|nr:hypothetical protein [Pseudonocardiaceae bacterium]